MYEYCKSCVHDRGDIGFCDKCGYTYMHKKHGLPPTEYEAEPKPPTNADRIRAMTDEEIADWFWWMYKEMARYTDSRVFVYDWLKQEAQCTSE